MIWVGAVAKAAAESPHLSRKKSECAPVSIVCTNRCSVFRELFPCEVFWPRIHRRFSRSLFLYIYICVFEDAYIYIYIYLGFWFDATRTRCGFGTRR